MSTTLRTLWAVGLVCWSLPAFAEPDALPVHQLIGKLGSALFGERQSATEALQALGTPALEALRTAALSPDLEIRIRAQELVAQIERQQDTLRLLNSAPAKVDYRDTPFADACQDFEARTGILVKLTQDPAVLSNRTVTLKAAGPRWQLVEQFCAAAGLVEVETRSLNKLFVLAKLNDGAARPALPTCYAGKLRFRALPVEAGGWGQATGVVDTTCKLEVAAEAGVIWTGVPEVRIHRAVDEQGQALEQCPPDDAGSNPVYRLRSPRLLMDDVNASGDTALRLPVRLKLAAKPSHRVKELQGTLIGQLETSPEPLLTVDAILKSANQTITGKDGSTLRVGEVSRDDDGVVKVAVDFNCPVPDSLANGSRGVNRAFLMKRAILDVRADSGNTPGFELRDGAGRAYESVRYNEVSQREPNRLSYSATLHFLPQDGAAEPARLTLSARRVVTVEVPFTLRDVPLP